MRRREFITLLGGTAAVWPLAARAQQSEPMRRIGVILPSGADDADFQTFFGAFLQTLGQLGWSIGTNLRVDIRWATGDAASIRKHTAELVALAPEVILTHGGSTISPMQQATRTIPVVFSTAGDPVAAGFADSLARPGGNITGFMNAEYSMAAKWLELLKRVAPSVTRAAILRDPRVPSGLGQFSAIQTAAISLHIEVSPINVRDSSEIERDVAAFARSSNGGLIVIGSSSAQQQRHLIVSFATRHKLPAVYFTRLFVSAGGLISYGVDFIDQYRRAAGYVDRILRGEKPSELPIQAPVKYQMVVNMKAAKAIGLTIPPSVLTSADEVIE
jgi:putative tryptophan/tyrosine transport system substrate-binding protein